MMQPTKADYAAAVHGEKPWPVNPTSVDFEVPEVKGVTLKDSFNAPIVPDEDDGFTNHAYRVCNGQPYPTDLPEYKQVFNRVIVIAPDIEKVKELQARLPEFFQVLEPIPLSDAIARDIRPSENRLLQATREEMNAFKDSKRGRVFFLAYAIFEYIEGYGGWIDLRDHYEQCKWGRRPVPHASGCTRSFQVLNGETTIEEVKAKCGFQ